MKPLFSVTTGIEIRAGYILNSLIRIGKIRKKARAFVVSSYKAWVLALLMACSATNTSATAGVVIVTHDYLIIVSDGAFTHTNDRGQVTKIKQGCKIAKQGNIFYFGVGEYGTPELHFDLYSIARNAIVKSGSVTNIYSAVEPHILSHLPAIVEHAKTAYPQGYAKWIRGGPVISLVFAAFENGFPTVVTIDFILNKNGTPAKPIEHTIVIRDPKQMTIGGVGYSEESTRRSNEPSWLADYRADPIKASEELIQAEIDAAVRRKDFVVGPPISVLKISKDFAGMVPGHQGSCQ